MTYMLKAIFIFSFIVTKAMAHGEGIELKSHQKPPPVFYRVVFDIDFRSEFNEGNRINYLKANESNNFSTVPLVDPIEWENVRKYFRSFYYTKDFFLLEIDSSLLQKIYWREHINLKKTGEYFAKVPRDAIKNVSYWVWDNSKSDYSKALNHPISCKFHYLK